MPDQRHRVQSDSTVRARRARWYRCALPLDRRHRRHLGQRIRRELLSILGRRRHGAHAEDIVK